MVFKAVRINYKIEERIDFCFLAEFFRLAGIYVVECLEGEEKSPYLSTDCYDVVIDTRELAEEMYNSETINFRELKENAELQDNIIRNCSREKQKQLLGNLISRIYAILMQNKSISEVWKCIIKVYVEEEIVLHSMNLQYYFKKPSFAIENAKKAFMNASETLSACMMDEGPDIRYFEYAKQYCKVKVNAGCNFMKQEFVFPIEKLGEECNKAIHKYPDFSNLKVLLGLCYEFAPEFARNAIYTFTEALEDTNMNCYSAHIFYWIGKRYEATEANHKEALDNYKKSYDRKQKYKNIYKLAVAERNAKKFGEAIKRFEDLIYKLSEKMRLCYADPLELEYYFKAYLMISLIYFNDLKEYLSAIKHGEHIRECYQIIVNNNRFYDDFYGEDAKQYRDLTIKRFNLEKNKLILNFSYQYLGIDKSV